MRIRHAVWFLCVSAMWIPSLRADDAKLADVAQSLYGNVKESKLPNGLRLFLKPIPGAPTVTVMTVYLVGSADEELDQTGLSHYLEHLMFKGTDKLMPGDIDRMTQRNGGRNNAFTSEDITAYHFDFAADRWQAGLRIEADRMRNLRIDEKHEFEQEKGAVISELDGGEDQPWELENKVVLPVLYGDKTPYGHPVIGEKAHVRSATAEIIKKHYDRWYHPNNAVIVIAGGFDPKEAEKLVGELFKDIPAGKLPARKAVPKDAPRKQIVRKKMVSKFESARMLFGFNTVQETDPDAPVLDLISMALTSGKTSRLHRRLIDIEGSATVVSASHFSGRYPGAMTIQVELAERELREVEEAVFEEITRVAEQGLEETELKRIKRLMIASHIFSHEDIHELADTIARGVITNDMKFVLEYLPNFMKVGNDDVKRVTRKWLLQRKPVIVESVPPEPKKGANAVPKRPGVSRAYCRALPRDVSPKSVATSFDLKSAKTVELPNGLKVILLENHRLPIVVASANVKNVALHEPPEQPGVAALLGALLEEGTDDRTAVEISTQIENVGAQLATGATGGSVKMLTTDTKLGLEVLLDCLISPTLSKADLEAKKAEIAAQESEEEFKPDSVAQRMFSKAIYGNHPFGRPRADVEVLKKLSVKDVRRFHQSVFVPNNSVVVVVGDFQADKVLEVIRQAVKDWMPRKMADPKIPALEIQKGPQLQVKSDESAAQLHVNIGHLGVRRKNPDYHKLLVLDYILGVGEGFTDRLSSNLRDRKGLAYSVGASITGSAGDEPGTFRGYIGTFPDKFTEVRDGFLKEINRIRDEEPTQQEVDDVKSYLLGSLSFTIGTCSDVASILLAVDRHQLGSNYWEDHQKAIRAVTPADVKAAARRYLHPDRLTIIAVGAIDAQGRPLKKE